MICDIWHRIYGIYLFIYYWIYISPSRANTSERQVRESALLGFLAAPQIVRLLSTSNLQPKYQTTGVNYTARSQFVVTVPRIANTACLPV